MNPSIVNNLPPEWTPTDPTTPKLKAAFSGVPVPIPGSPGPSPGPGPQPPVDPVQAQIDALRQENMIQQIQLDWCIRQLRK